MSLHFLLIYSHCKGVNLKNCQVSSPRFPKTQMVLTSACMGSTHIQMPSLRCLAVYTYTLADMDGTGATRFPG